MPDSLVFPFRPDWQQGVTERLSFKTDVLRSETAAEQRRGLREFPRRYIEADFLVWGSERTFYDTFMNRLGGSEMLVPLYWEAVNTSTTLSAGVTDRIDFDTAFREYAVGDQLIVIGSKATIFEVVEVAEVDSGGIGLVSPVTRTWGPGTSIMPLRSALIDDTTQLNHVTAAVARSTVRFVLVEGNERTVPEDPAPIYGTLPVFTEEPNWVDNLESEFTREGSRFDSDTGLIYQTDPLARAFIGQAHRWFLVGAERLALFRDMLYRRAGRLGMFWLPTFKADLLLAEDIAEADDTITVKNAGLAYTNVPTAGREYLAIWYDGGVAYRRITEVSLGSDALEIVTLDSPVGLDLARGQVRKISFMDTARFDQDDFEITHHAGIEGLHECQSAFRALRNVRTAPMPINYPIPTAIMTADGCGGVVMIPPGCHTAGFWNNGPIGDYQPDSYMEFFSADLSPDLEDAARHFGVNNGMTTEDVDATLTAYRNLIDAYDPEAIRIGLFTPSDYNQLFFDIVYPQDEVESVYVYGGNTASPQEVADFYYNALVYQLAGGYNQDSETAANRIKNIINEIDSWGNASPGVLCTTCVYLVSTEKDTNLSNVLPGFKDKVRGFGMSWSGGYRFTGQWFEESPVKAISPFVNYSPQISLDSVVVTNSGGFPVELPHFYEMTWGIWAKYYQPSETWFDQISAAASIASQLNYQMPGVPGIAGARHVNGRAALIYGIEMHQSQTFTNAFQPWGDPYYNAIAAAWFYVQEFGFVVKGSYPEQVRIRIHDPELGNDISAKVFDTIPLANLGGGFSAFYVRDIKSQTPFYFRGHVNDQTDWGPWADPSDGQWEVLTEDAPGKRYLVICEEVD